MASAAVDKVAIASSRLVATISLLGAELTRLRSTDGGDLRSGHHPAVRHGRAPTVSLITGLLRNGRYHYEGERVAVPKHDFALRDDLFGDDALILDSLTSRSECHGNPGRAVAARRLRLLPMLGIWTTPGSFQIPPGETCRLAMTITLED